MGELIPIVAIIGVFGGGVAVVWIIARAFTERTRTRKEELEKLLDKFDTADEFVRFAETAAGARVVDAITKGREESAPRSAKSVHRGVVALFLGLGFLAGALTFEYDMIILAWILIALGAGFLISAYVTNRLQEKDDDTEMPVPEEFAPASSETAEDPADSHS